MDVSCWVVSDGRAGIEAQCLGLAEAMGLAPVIKRVRLRAPWRQLSPALLRLGNAHACGPGSDPIAQPWPGNCQTNLSKAQVRTNLTRRTTPSNASTVRPKLSAWR